eukprot:jgi/Ulvmu1/6903/UM031_0110.1
MAGIGGPILLETLLHQLYMDDRGLCDTLDVLCQKKGAPVITHASYKTVRAATKGDRSRGMCNVVIGVRDGEPVLCDAPCCGGPAQRYQLCFDHLHAPVIFQEDPANPDHGFLLRFCQHKICRRVLPLSDFMGLSPMCTVHSKGHLADGGTPTIESLAAHEHTAGFLFSTPVPLKTLVAGGHGGADIRRVE